MASKAWPYEEARKLLKRWPEGKPAGEPVIFETGYGPSGLPHIGTFNEVARTTFVRHAYEELTGEPDPADRLQRRHGRAAQGPRQCPQPGDADGKSRQAADPDPRPVRRRTKASRTTTMRCFGSFLDRFGFDYEFLSATECYTQRPVRRGDPQGAPRLGRAPTSSATAMLTMSPSRRLISAGLPAPSITTTSKSSSRLCKRLAHDGPEPRAPLAPGQPRDREVGLAQHDDLRARVGLRLDQHRVHARLGRDARRRRLHDLRPPELAAVRCHAGVVAHVLGLERRDAQALVGQQAAERGGQVRLAGVRRAALHHQRLTHRRPPARARCRPRPVRGAAALKAYESRLTRRTPSPPAIAAIGQPPFGDGASP